MGRGQRSKMFEGEERWSRNCGSGIGLANHKNIYKDATLCGNWCEQLYGRTMEAPSSACEYSSVTMRDFDRKPIDPERQRGSSNVEAVPYELLFGHGEELYGETRAGHTLASISDLQFTKPELDKPKAHELLWLGDKANNLNMPTIVGARQTLLEENKKRWEDELEDTSSTSVTRDNFRDPKEQPVMHFKTEPRKPRANYLGRTLAAPHLT